MTEKGKDRAITITASFITSVIVVIVAFTLNASRGDQLMINTKIDEKLDKVIYEKDKERDEIRFQRIENMQIQDRQDYIKTVSTIETHVIWIRQELEKLNNKNEKK